MLTLDPTTHAAYELLYLGTERAACVFDALPNPVTVRVYNGSGQIMGQGTMNTPWATLVDTVLTVGEVASFTVLVSGTPDPASWYLRFESGGRYLQGTFGLYGSGADFTWRKASANEPVSWVAGQPGSIGAVDATAYDVPIVFGWTIPDEPYTAPGAWRSQTAGQSYDASQLVQDPTHIGIYAIVSQAKNDVPGSYGFTVDPATGVIALPSNLVDPATIDYYAVAVDLSKPVATAEQDWLGRAGGKGVLWAHRFNSPTAEGLYWGQRSNNASPRRVGYLSNTATQSGASGTRADGGVIGDGCLEIYIPAGTVVTGGWARPLGPVKAATPGGSYIPYGDDPAANGTVPRLGFNDAYSVIPGDPGGKFGNCAGGFITHPDYLANNQRTFTLASTPGGTTYNEIAYAGPNGFFIQYRVKFKTLPNGDNRLDYTGLYGKFTMLGCMDPNNTNCEIVNNVMPQMGNQFYLYGARGYNTLASPQGVTSAGSKAQPGGDYDATCLYTGGDPNYPNPAQCWCWPKDEWVTVLLQIIPGHHNDQADWATNGAFKDTGIRVWVAREGASSYTKIWDKTDYSMNYGYFDPPGITRSPTLYASGGGNSLGGTPQAYGYNSFRFEMYANPNNQDPVTFTKDVWVLIDQVICSTETIPCPVPT